MSSSACEERGLHILNPDGGKKREWVAVLQNGAHNHTVPYPIKSPLGQTSSELEAGSLRHGRITEPQEGKLYLNIADNLTPVGESTPSVHEGTSTTVEVPVLCKSLYQFTRDELKHHRVLRKEWHVTKPSSSKYASLLQWHLDVERRTECCNWKLPHRKLDMPVKTFT